MSMYLFVFNFFSTKLSQKLNVFYKDSEIIVQSMEKTSEPRYEKTGFFAYAKTKTQISFAVTAKLISAFVFATRIVQSLFYRNPKLQASSPFLWLYSPVCVGPARKPRSPVFSQQGSSCTVYERLKHMLHILLPIKN